MTRMEALEAVVDIVTRCSTEAMGPGVAEEIAQSIIAAVTPSIAAEALERAAVVADKERLDADADMRMAGDDDPTGYQQSYGAEHAATRIAAAIRALKETTP